MMKTRFSQKSLIVALVMVAALGVSALAGQAFAQGTFSNASLHGTYPFSHFESGPGEPVFNWVTAGAVYFDGEGTHRGMFTTINEPGEPDADGNPTRNVVATIADPSTWFLPEYGPEGDGPYDVTPYGLFTITIPAFGVTLDAIPTWVEMIDGVPIIMEYETWGANPATGGIFVVRAYRISGDKLLPPEPAE